MTTPATTSSNGQGTTALVLGILAVTLIFIPGVSTILAIVFGANGRAAARTGHATNGTAATWGLALGIVNVVIWGALILLWQLGQ